MDERKPVKWLNASASQPHQQTLRESLHAPMPPVRATSGDCDVWTSHVAGGSADMVWHFLSLLVTFVLVARVHPDVPDLQTFQASRRPKCPAESKAAGGDNNRRENGGNLEEPGGAASEFPASEFPIKPEASPTIQYQRCSTDLPRHRNEITGVARSYQARVVGVAMTAWLALAVPPEPAPRRGRAPAVRRSS